MSQNTELHVRRKHEDNLPDSTANSKQQKLTDEKDKDENIETKKDSFLAWCQIQSLKISPKVVVTRAGSCAQYGMVATADICEGDCLFEIPRRLLLHPSTSAIAQTLRQESEALVSKSNWVGLLLCLCHEYNNKSSMWRPYLQIVPDFSELDLPMFWPRGDMEGRLQGTGVPEAVQQDSTNIEKEFNDIALPFMKKHPDLFAPEVCSLEFYKKMVAFVMAYSFTEPANQNADDDDENEAESATPPMMVPMADILNHIAKNNAALQFGQDSLKMVATEDILQGIEVFNTYGELSNGQLLHMYGFAEDRALNHYDTVEITAQTLSQMLCIDTQGQDTMQQNGHCNSKTQKPGVETPKPGKEIPKPDVETPKPHIALAREKYKLLEELGMISDDHTVICVLGTEGVLNEDEFCQVLYVLGLDDAEFQIYAESVKHGDEWEEAVGPESLNCDDIPGLDHQYRAILHGVIVQQTKLYKHSYSWEDSLRVTKWVSQRDKYSHFVRLGQLLLLDRYEKLCEMK